MTVNNAPVRASVADAQFYVQWMDNLLTKTSPGGAWNSYFPTSRAAAQARYQAAKAMYQQIALEAAQQPTMLSITTTSLPDGALNVSYSATLAASGGTTPYTWSIIKRLAADRSVAQQRNRSHLRNTSCFGTFNFTAQVTDSGNPTQIANKSLEHYRLRAGEFHHLAKHGGPRDRGLRTGQRGGTGGEVPFRFGGYITGIRFYKASANTGTHVGNLWTSSGTLLATATFTNETASGWQQVNFSSPVAITANTVYVASYHANVGHYSDDQNYFQGAGVDSPPLHALADGVSGVNGVYAYGSTSSFPNQGWRSSNYWVDVVFQP